MASPLATFQAGQIGFKLSLTQGSNPPNFTGAALTLHVTNPANVVTHYTNVTIDTDGKTPIYLTSGTDFPSAGNYQVQLQYVNGGETYWSPVGTVKVLVNLG